MNGQEMWSKFGLQSVLPPKLNKQPNRPNKVRKGEYDESITTRIKLRKFYTEIKCGRCG